MERETQKSVSAKTLWIWVVLAFVVLISAWTVLIVIASKNQPEIIEIQEP